MNNTLQRGVGQSDEIFPAAEPEIDQSYLMRIAKGMERLKLNNHLSETVLQADLFKTNLGWLVLAGYQTSSRQSRNNYSVQRLLIGNDTKREAEARWKNEIQTGWLSKQVFSNQLNKIRFSNWYPQCRIMLEKYGRGSRVDFSPIACNLFSLTPFQQQVLHATRKVTSGKVQTYGEIAERIGRPQAARAVGGTMARNPIPIIIPCHRIIGSKGKLTGFTAPGGLTLKQKLLKLEQGYK